MYTLQCTQSLYFPQFLKLDKLNVRSERVLFEAVMKWYRALPAERVKHLADVLSYVKLALLTSSYLQGEVFDSIGDINDTRWVLGSNVRQHAS